MQNKIDHLRNLARTIFKNLVQLFFCSVKSTCRQNRNHFLHIVFAHFRTRSTESKCNSQVQVQVHQSQQHIQRQIYSYIKRVAILHPCRPIAGLGKFARELRAVRILRACSSTIGRRDQSHLVSSFSATSGSLGSRQHIRSSYSRIYHSYIYIDWVSP